MKRAASPLVGGVVTSLVMKLAAYPALSHLWESHGMRSAPPAAAEAPGASASYRFTGAFPRHETTHELRLISFTINI